MATSTIETQRYRNEIEGIWTIRDVKSILGDTASVVDSPLIDSRWKFTAKKRSVGGVQMLAGYLYALPLADDYENASEGRSWVHRGKTFLVMDLLNSTDGVLATNSYAEPYRFDSSKLNWGWHDMFTASDTLAAMDTEGAIRIRFRIQTCEPDPVRNAKDDIALLIFDNPTCSDVVLEVRAGENSPVGRIFASKAILCRQSDYFKTLFGSGFSETKTLVSIDTTSHARGDQSFDEDDMSPFDLATTGVIRTTATSDTSAGEVEMIEEDGSNSMDEPSNGDSFRKYFAIQVDDTPFEAYRSLIAFLYTGSISFSTLPSQWLVARHEARTKHEGSDDTFTFPSRNEWLQAEFVKSAQEAVSKGITPASLHAVYRLADRYSLTALRDLAKAHIVKQLSVDNAPYELFSPLSLTFPDVQDSVLSYFSKNWNEVKKTPAFHKVLDHLVEGNLASSRELTAKVFMQTL